MSDYGLNFLLESPNVSLFFTNLNLSLLNLVLYFPSLLLFVLILSSENIQLIIKTFYNLLLTYQLGLIVIH
jgi:hypothetical protein